MAKQQVSNSKQSNGANLGFEAKMWTAADKLRNNMDAAEYKHVVLGLIFLKYISDAFAEVYLELKNDPEKLSNPEVGDYSDLNHVPYCSQSHIKLSSFELNFDDVTLGIAAH